MLFDLLKLESKRCTQVLTSKEDKDNCGCFVQYRVAFYIAGDEDSLQNFFLLLDSFLQFRAKQYARQNNFEVGASILLALILVCRDHT